MRNPLAGKKLKLLYRNPDKSTVLQVEDEHDEILVTVEADGTMHEERWTGIAGIRRDWEAAAPSGPAVLVPNDAGRKVWTRLGPEPVAARRPAPHEPKPEPEPKPVVSVSRDPQYERYKPPRESELTRRMAWGPGWDL